jgi:hypothetical protein
MSTAEIQGWLIETWEWKSCAVCATPTNLVDSALRVPLCRGTCTVRWRVDRWVAEASGAGKTPGQS